MASRESVVEALFTLIQEQATFTTAGRRLVAPENVTPAMSPALYLVAHADPYKRTSIDGPPARDLHMMAVVYNNVGTDDSAIPETFINNLLDALDGVFRGENALQKKNTLGGLVYACFIEGTVQRGSGDVSGLASAFIPIRIILP